MEQNSRKSNTNPEITLYTTEPCARCYRAKALLESHGLQYHEVNLVKDPVGRRELAEFTGQKTFPQIGWNPQTVTAHTEAKQGTSITRVPLVDAFPSSLPPGGYHVTGVSIDVTGGN